MNSMTLWAGKLGARSGKEINILRNSSIFILSFSFNIILIHTQDV